MSFQQEEKDLIRNNIRRDRDKNPWGWIWLLVIFLPTCIIIYPGSGGSINGILFLLWVLAIVCVGIYTLYFTWRSRREANEWLKAHGREVIVTMTDKIIDSSQRDGENTPAHFFELTWVDPSSGASRSLRERVNVVRYEQYRIGAKLIMAYDTYDPSFHEVLWYR